MANADIYSIRQDIKLINRQIDRLNVLVTALARILIVDMGGIDLDDLDKYIDEINGRKTAKFDLRSYLEEKLSAQEESMLDLTKSINIKDLLKKKKE